MTTGEDEPQALGGLRVIDLSRWVAGEYATKMFADFGADVIKVERPGTGSLTRTWRLSATDPVEPETSPLFLHLNTNKRSIALDLADGRDRDVLLSLVVEADAVVESFRPGGLERLGLGPDVLLARNPRLVVTRISAFGQTGPHRDWEASGLVLQATGGPMHATGDREREPLRKPGALEQYTIGRTAAEATLAGIRSSELNGHGCVVDVSGQEALLSSADRRASYLMTAAYSGVDAPRGTRSAHRGRTTFTGLFPAKDGYVMVYVTNQAFWNRLVNLVGADSPEFRATYLDRAEVLHDRDEFVAFVRDWFAVRPKQQIMEEGMAARIPLTAMLAMDELLELPHLRERGAFAVVEHPVAGTLSYPGAPWRMPGGFALHRAAPLLDEHGPQLRTLLRHGSAWVPGAGPAAAPGSSPVGSPAGEPRPPLEGVRVVDLTVVWAGPGATALLGDLGAEVIRVEANDRVSRQVSAHITKEQVAAMGYHAATYPDQDPGARPYDRTALFTWHARNKRAASMNLDTPEGQAAIRALIAISDVFVENNSSTTLEKLGLGHDELLRINPRLVVLRMPPMGLTGPMSDYLGYGPNFNALVGIASMDGYEGESPDTAGENYHMDEASPPAAAFAVLAALRRRDRTGTGCLIEFAQSENVLHDVGEYVVEHQRSGRNPVVHGNAHPLVDQAVVPASGEDRWVALTVRTEAQRAALGRLLGREADLRAPAGRAALAAWTRAQDPDDLVTRLQAAGVPAAEVLSERQVLADPHLAAREWFQVRSHPFVGTHPYPGHPFRATGMTLRFGRALPGFGEDNEYVYRTLLGYPDEVYADLERRRLISKEQFA